MFERLSFEELRHEEGAAVVGHPVVEHTDDVGVADTVGERALPAKAGNERGVVQEAPVEHFDRDAAPIRVPSHEHGAGAALAEHTFDLPLAPEDRACTGVPWDSFHGYNWLFEAPEISEARAFRARLAIDM